MPVMAVPLALKGFALAGKLVKGKKIVSAMKKGSKARELLVKGFQWVKSQAQKVQQVQRNQDGSFTASGKGFQIKTPSFAPPQRGQAQPQEGEQDKKAWLIPALIVGALILMKK